MIESLIKDIALDSLYSTEMGACLKKGMDIFTKVQETLVSYMSDDSEEWLKKVKIGTVATFAILDRVVTGKDIKDFTAEDWEDIANNVAEYAIIQDGLSYSVSVFKLYADYVDSSVELLRKKQISEEKCVAIEALAEDVRRLNDQVINEEITEPDYTEKCLWILLEAMIKLLAAYSSTLIGEDASEFAEAISMFAFEYGRYTMYQKELELISGYLQNQKEIDEELKQKYDIFCEDMQTQENIFKELIKDAYSENIAARIRSSVDVARNAGVDEKDILDSTQKIDEFFM